MFVGIQNATISFMAESSSPFERITKDKKFMDNQTNVTAPAALASSTLTSATPSPATVKTNEPLKTNIGEAPKPIIPTASVPSVSIPPGGSQAPKPSAPTTVTPAPGNVRKGRINRGRLDRTQVPPAGASK
jgi:hypothetical protein